MAPGVIALRRDKRRIVTTPEETPSALPTHLARAITRYVRQLRKDGLPVPFILDELAAFLTLYVRTRQAATGVDGDYRTPQDVTVERLIAAGRLPLVHVEGASRLRVADLEAYVDSLVMPDAERPARGNEG
jgi:hypothetical protein